MGLGGSPSEWDEYEWVRLSDLSAAGSRARRRARPGADADAAGALAEAICRQLDRAPLWPTAGGTRIVVVDLDNLRAGPMHWRARMAVVTALGRQADHLVMAGQSGAVARARPHLAEFADRAQSVADGSDVADRALLAAVAGIEDQDLHLVVISNDGIFAALAERGSLIVLSPGAEALSDRLREVADRTIDLAELERSFDPQLAPPAPIIPVRAVTVRRPRRTVSLRQGRSGA